MTTMNYSLINQLVQKYAGEEVTTEYLFHPARKWRVDYAIPKRKVAIEVEGALWHESGRHSSDEGILRDMHKYNEAAALGWLVIRVRPQELLSLRTLVLVANACKTRQPHLLN